MGRAFFSFMVIDINSLDDKDLCALVENRWQSSSTVWDIIERVYKTNTAIYENRAAWLDGVAYKRKQWTVQANRIFVNMEAVINSLIANPAGINLLPGRNTPQSQEFASDLENFLKKKFADLNIKEVDRMALRNLYFSRLAVQKAFWNPKIDDFDFKAIDPRVIRISSSARKENDSEFAIEEIEDNLCAVVSRFPKKEEELMKKFGFKEKNEMYIKNPTVKYKEAWIQDYVIFKLDNIILDKIKNPYWDWDGILLNEEEMAAIQDENTDKIKRRSILSNAKMEYEQRSAMQGAEIEGETMDTEQESTNKLNAYYFNYFDTPRKPYIFATILNNENSPIGRTDMITLSADLQKGIDKRKMDIDENCELVNGIIKVDAETMGKSDAQRLRFETKGIVWGKGVKDGVTRETGTPLPQMVFDDMNDSRNEIDNIMAATSAFKGERQGQETKAGRLALIQQSYLRLNELVQVVDYMAKEKFEWALQLAKTRYTEHHYAKWQGKEDAQKIIELIQDDIEDGIEITVTAGKSLPTDDEFKFEQAQNDVQAGLISPADYVRIAQYDDPKQIAKNKVLYDQNPAEAVGLKPEEMPMPAQPGEFQPNQMEEILAAQPEQPMMM